MSDAIVMPDRLRMRRTDELIRYDKTLAFLIGR